MVFLFCQRTGTLFQEQKYQIFQYKIENRSLNIICFRYSNLLKIKFQICLTLIYLFTLLKNIKIQSLGIVVTKAKTKWNVLAFTKAVYSFVRKMFIAIKSLFYSFNNIDGFQAFSIK